MSSTGSAGSASAESTPAPIGTPRTFTVHTPAGAVTGTVYDYGAHVTSWTVDGVEYLWLSSKALYEQGRAIRGGIPICFPWFGGGRFGQTPAHGYARTTTWTFEGSSVSDDGVTAVWTLPAGSMPGEGETYALRYEVTFGAQFSAAFTVTNTSDESVSFEEALHTYLAVDDVRTASIGGLDSAPYFDKIDSTNKTQLGDVVLTEMTDRVYARPTDVVVTGVPGGRSIHVVGDGSANTVVWNPWEAEGARIADMGEGEWAQMLCVEAGNVLDDAVVLGPGESHTLTYRIVLV